MLSVKRSRMVETSDFESLYRDHFAAITEFGISSFELPSDVAEELAHEVLLAGIHHLERMPDTRTWLLAMMASAASHASKDRS